jgi:hypothetical protein
MPPTSAPATGETCVMAGGIGPGSRSGGGSIGIDG